MPAQYDRLVTLVVTLAAANTPQRLSATSLMARSCEIYAADANTAPIFVGDSTVLASTATGRPLQPGEPWGIAGDAFGARALEFDLNNVWFDSGTISQKVVISYFRSSQGGA